MTYVIALILLLLSTSAFAQTPTPVPVGAGSKLTWDVFAADLPTAQGMSYRLYRDGATGIPVVGVVCTAPVLPTTPVGAFPCSAPFLADTPGAIHSITLTATANALESPPSLPFRYLFVLVPLAPVNVKSK